MLNNMLKNLVTEYVDNGETKDVFKSEADHFVMLKQKMSLRVKKKIVLQNIFLPSHYSDPFFNSQIGLTNKTL